MRSERREVRTSVQTDIRTDFRTGERERGARRLPGRRGWRRTAAAISWLLIALPEYAPAQQSAPDTGGADFGAALVTLDFDADGQLDLAVGAPGEDGAQGVVALFRSGAQGALEPAGRLSLADLGLARPGDRFGAALASADFDGDGAADLAVGAPFSAGMEEGTEAGGPGAVFVYRGSPSGLTPAQAIAGLPGGAGSDRPGDAFGSALAAADFDGDGIPDLAIGAPGRSGSAGAELRSGSVVVYRGTRTPEAGVGLVPDSTLPSRLRDFPESAPTDGFGSALAAADFDGDGSLDLAIGAPGRAVQGGARAGLVFLFTGSAAGLAPRQLVSQELGELGTSQNAEDFGRALAAGDLDDDGIGDLAIGVPAESAGAGRVHVLRGSSGGLVAGEAFGLDDIETLEATAGDAFGRSLVSADLDGDGIDDLAVGAPGAALDDGPPSGFALRLLGGPGDLEPDTLFSEQFSGGGSAGDGFAAVLAAGDLDGDGTADLIVGAPTRSGAPDVPPTGAIFTLFSGDTEDQRLGTPPTP